MRPALTGLASLTLAGLALSTSAFAQGRDALSPMGSPGELPHLQVKGDAALELPVRHTDVKAEIDGFVARVVVDQVFANASPDPIEAIYTFPLPEHSAVEGFTLVAGDRHIEAEVRKREDAKRTYEQARSEGHTAALLEQERPNIFTQSVANLPPGEQIHITIRFSELLNYDAGEYEFVFPLVVGPRYVPGAPSGAATGTGTRADTARVPDASRISPPVLPSGTRSGHDVSIAVDVNAGRAIETPEVPSHDVAMTANGTGRYHLALADHETIPNRDFVLRYRVHGAQPSVSVLAHKTDATGAFAVVLQPPELNVDQLVGKREILFVVDISGSMWGLPLWLCQEAMRDALSRLRPDDTFNILTFSGATQFAFEKPRRATPENVGDALGFVEKMRAGGGTEMLSAITGALAPDVEQGRRRYVFFLTDGWVGNDAELIGATHKYTEGLAEKSQIGRVFSFGVGSAPNRALLDGIASAGNGATVYATNREDPRRGVDAFFRRIDHPIIEALSVDWNGLDVREVTPAVSPDLFLSKPLIIQGLYGHGGATTIHVRGKTEDGQAIDLPFAVTLPDRESSGEELETLWARAQIEELSNAQAFDALSGTRKIDSRKKQITELGLRYHLATAYTSFVAVDRSHKVAMGKPHTVVQPVEVPEDTDAHMAGAEEASNGVLGGHGVGGLGGRAYGSAVASSGMLKSLSISGYGAGMGGVISGQGAGGGGTGELGGLGTISEGRGKSGGDEGKMGKKGYSLPAIGDAQVSGSLDTSAIRNIIHAHLREIRFCYESQLQKNPKLAGKLVVKFTLGADGHITKIELAEDTLKQAEVGQCVLTRFQRWRFPASPNGEVTVSYPINFESPN
ncbi:MAG: AgmX/PglI C-terminal domain-containing protein [Deltaproteobacteria bacterium]|nr:AgmX/PglI C-terminal domain-containing protein [Deltaproteobacteria bacterium]